MKLLSESKILLIRSCSGHFSRAQRDPSCIICSGANYKNKPRPEFKKFVVGNETCSICFLCLDFQHKILSENLKNLQNGAPIVATMWNKLMNNAIGTVSHILGEEIEEKPAKKPRLEETGVSHSQVDLPKKEFFSSDAFKSLLLPPSLSNEREREMVKRTKKLDCKKPFHSKNFTIFWIIFLETCSWRGCESEEEVTQGANLPIV